MTRIDRREFLKRGAAMAGAVAGGGLFAAPGTRARPVHHQAPELGELAATLDGRVVLPQTARYRAARLVWNSRYDGARPEPVIQAASAADVRKVVDFAREGRRRLVARSGAHSFAGYSTGDGLVLDLSGLTDVEVSGDGQRARLGAGSTTLPTYRALWEHGKAISAGTCPTVGIAGLTAGGGLGVLSRRHGLTCDNLIEVEIVTADGRLVRADERRHADLYWATRGGGGGNFGVVTALTFALVPVDMPFTHLEYEFPWTAALNVLAAWQDWLPGSPQGTWSAVELLTQAPQAGSPTVALEIVHAGPPGGGGGDRRRPAGGRGPAHRRGRRYRPVRRPRARLLLQGPAAQGMQARRQDARRRLPARRPLCEDRRRLRAVARGGPRHADRLDRAAPARPDPDPARVLLRPHDRQDPDRGGRWGGELDPARRHRIRAPGQLFVAQYQARWRRRSPRHVVDANLDWAHGLYAAVEPYRSGFGYQNYIDPDLRGWKHAYYGANLARLREVKSRYDPDDFFRFAQSIPPA